MKKTFKDVAEWCQVGPWDEFSVWAFGDYDVSDMDIFTLCALWNSNHPETIVDEMGPFILALRTMKSAWDEYQSSSV